MGNSQEVQILSLFKLDVRLRRDTCSGFAEAITFALVVELATGFPASACFGRFFGAIELRAMTRTDTGAVEPLSPAFCDPVSTAPPCLVMDNDNFVRRAAGLARRDTAQIRTSKSTGARNNKNPNPLHRIDSTLQLQGLPLSVNPAVKRMGFQLLGWPPWPPETPKLIAKQYQRFNGTPRSPVGCSTVLDGGPPLKTEETY